MAESRDRVLAAGPSKKLGVDDPRLRFGEDAHQDRWRGRRLMWLDGKAAFELSFWCGTCPFLFKRLEGANQKLSLADLEQRLIRGVSALDDEVISRFAELLPLGDYIPMLLRISPHLVLPMKAGDYFSEEQVATWGIDSFWGLPEYPQVPYYRTYETPVDASTHLFEFVVPMVPPSWNEPARVAEYRQNLQTSDQMTAFAVSILDICQPALEGQAVDYFSHWALTHFLLDGHHKMQAAAAAGKALQLLTLLSLDASLAAADDVKRVPKLRSGPPEGRPPK